MANVSVLCYLGQVQILWMQDLPLSFPFRERFTYCQAERRWQFSSQNVNNGIVLHVYCISRQYVEWNVEL